MIADGLDDKLDLILVKSISRFFRNIVDCQQYVKRLQAKGVEVYFEREHLSTMDPSAEMLFSLMGAIAQNESRSISEHMKWSLQKRFERGEYRLGSNKVLGYDTNKEGELVPNEDAWIIRMAFQLFSEGKGYTEIAQHLTSVGAHRLRSERPMAVSTIQHMVRNEIYVGDRRLQKQAPRDFLSKRIDPTKEYKSYYLTDDHEPIVDRETWNKVQHILAETKLLVSMGVSSKGKNHHVLFGRVFCGVCGAPYLRRTLPGRLEPGEVKSYHKVWNCKTRQMGKAGNGCKNDFIGEDELLRRITQQLGWESFDEQLFTQTVRRVDILSKRVLAIEYIPL